MQAVPTEDYLSLVALILVLFIMIVFGFGVLVVGFFNLKSILKSSILFYSLLGALMLWKLIGDLYFTINLILIVQGKRDQEFKGQLLAKFESFYKNGMYVSDFVLCSMFLVLMKQFHSLQAQALLDKDSSLIRKTWTFIQLFEFAGFAVFIGLFNFGILNFVQTSISIAILNLLPCILYLAINLYANISMTGTLAEPDIAQRLKHTNKRLFWFFFSRVLQGTYEIILITNIGNTPFINVILNIEKATGEPLIVLICYGIYLAQALLTELIPVIVSIRTSTAKLMQPISLSNTLKESILSSNSSFISLMNNESEVSDIKEVDLKDFETIQVLSGSQNGFGIVKKGKMMGRIMVLRTIQTQFSKYLLEEIATQIQQRKKLDIDGLMSIRYSVLESKSISFMTDYYEYNLGKIIDAKKKLNQSIRLMYQLTEVVTELHKRNLPHGTLKVNNIYLAGSHIKLADHGFLSLKKFMSITQGYSNKSIYTAPELLSGRYSVVVNPTKEGDVYALGMIMFQVFSGITVYRNLPIQEVEASFKNKQIRPKIPGNLPTQLQNLVRNCWQQDPTQRPSIQEVGLVLREYRNKFN